MEENGKLHTPVAVCEFEVGGRQIRSGHCEGKNNLCLCWESNPHFPLPNHYNEGATQAVITL